MRANRARRRAAAAATLLLAALLLARNPPAELLRRVRFLSRSAPRDLAVRRLGGSSTAFDRRFFFFLESARRKLPPEAAGVAIYTPRPDKAQLYLASYDFAPLPVLLSPPSVPPGWVAAIYGPERPAGWTLLLPVAEGALMLPPARTGNR